MSKESLVKALKNESYCKWITTICNSLNFNNYSGQFDDKGRQEKVSALEATRHHGFTLRQIANALNLCQRPRD